jgi:CheY-like chemotaxis protein/nitrogen-specific signal transduction histidine kinase
VIPLHPATIPASHSAKAPQVPMSDHATSSTLLSLATALAAEPSGDLRAGSHAERLAGLSSLATGMAADLSALLAPILMAAGLLGDRARDGHDNVALTMLEDAARRGDALIRQILALAGEEGRSTPVRPAQLLEDARRFVAETFPHAVDVVVEAGAEPVVVRGEPTELHQVLVTFCMDAREAMPAGGRLTLKSEIVETSQATHDAPDHGAPGRFVVLSVSDTGVGTKTPLPHRAPVRALEVVAQAHAAAKRVVKSHGGFVDIATEAGRGTTVRIHLPVMPAGFTPHDVRPPAPPRGRDELVLVVDDEASVRSITEQVLRAFGYRVVTATSGAEAVTLHARHGREIAAVLLDMMPVTDGVSTIHALRTVDADVQIIAASVSAGGGPALNAVAPEVAAFLPKPYTSAALLHMVRAVLDRQSVAGTSVV